MVDLEARLDATALHIPVVAALVVAAAFPLLDLPAIDGWLVLLAASGAWLVYLADRLWLISSEDSLNRPTRHSLGVRHGWYRWTAAGVAGVGVTWSVLHVSPAVMAAGAVLAVAAVLHAVPIGGFRGKSRSVLKVVLIALAWGLGSGWVPAIDMGLFGPATAAPNGASLSGAGPQIGLVIALVAVRALSVAANVMLCDRHDEPGDRQAGIASLAAILGGRETLGVASVLLLAAGLLAGVTVLLTGEWLWAGESLVPLIFALYLLRRRGGRGTSPVQSDVIPRPVSLDLWVAAPALATLVLVLVMSGIG